MHRSVKNKTLIAHRKTTGDQGKQMKQILVCYKNKLDLRLKNSFAVEGISNLSKVITFL